MSQKLLKKLADKKYREETGLFLVEGKKSIEELLGSDFIVPTMYTTLEEMDHIEALARHYSERTGHPLPEVICVSPDTLGATGTYRSNNAGIAIAQQKVPYKEEALLEAAHTSLILVLDEVRDPGNLGTIIRTADWFGVSHIVTSPTTTDLYNPKTIAATMGSFTRISVTPLPLPSFLGKAAAHDLPIRGAFLDGTNILTTPASTHGLLVMGSESHGIGDTLTPFITERITIPRFGKAESLNVAIATAVILSALRRGG